MRIQFHALIKIWYKIYSEQTMANRYPKLSPLGEREGGFPSTRFAAQGAVL
jgi:hypothetical protein